MAAAAAADRELGPIPVTRADVGWGDTDAPVTIVMFADFECRYCGDAARTVEALKEKYGPARVRFVFKHLPLDIHDRAYAVSIFAEGLRVRSGDDAFWAFYRRVFLEREEGESPGEAIGRALAALTERGIRVDMGREVAEAGAAKVDADLEIGEALGIRGTPAFFINGVSISGAQPKSRFEAVIDAELDAVKTAVAGGLAPARVYAVRTAQNRDAAAARDRAEALSVTKDETVWFVPVGASPTKGSADALVTIVMFTDFECPFCAKAQKALAAVEKKYGADVRFVFKHNPLPFHKSADPAAQLTHEAFTKKGAAGFWAAHDALFKLDRPSDERDYREIAAELGLDEKATLAAIQTKRHAAAIATDQDLASEIEADGTPTFFINGRRLTGARSIAEFSEVIDERLSAAKALAAAGTEPARVYDEIMSGAKRAPAPEKLAIGPAPRGAPQRGSGAVVLQIFSEFECPFCRKHAATLTEMEKTFPGQIKIVWRHLPLPFHKNARPAAVAALEAKKQLGEKGFWRMHDRLFEAQAERSLGRAGVEAIAKDLGLDQKRLAAALDGNRYDAVIQADLDEAKKLGVEGTPATFVDGYFVSGAVSAAKLRRVIRLALADRAAAPTKKPAKETAP